MMPVEIGQRLSSNTSGDGRDVIDVGFLHHCAHGLLNSALGELELCVLFPDGFEVEVRTSG